MDTTFDLDACDRNRSLVQLELVAEDDLERAGDVAPALFRAASKPMRRIEPGELCLFLRHGLVLVAAVPMAIERLIDAPFLQAIEWPGDLLTALLEVDLEFWKAQPQHWDATRDLLASGLALIQTQDENGEPIFPIGDGLAAAIMHFMGARA